MKKLYFLLFLACSFIANAQIVNIPDSNFKNFLLYHSPVIDINNDYQIQVSEALAYTGSLNYVKYDVDDFIIQEQIFCQNFAPNSSEYTNCLLDIPYQQNYIRDLTGLEAFKNVSEIKFKYVQLVYNGTISVSNFPNLTKFEIIFASMLLRDGFLDYNVDFDLSDNPNLKEVNIETFSANSNNNSPLFYGQTRITNLDLTNSNSIEKIKVYYCFLPSIDVSDKLNLITLNLHNNYILTSLNTSNNVGLTELYCTGNNTFLDVTNNTALKTLYCSSNSFTNLDISQNENLERLSLYYNNQLTNLDVSQNPSLKFLYCGSNNQLTNLDVSQNLVLESLYCNNNQLTSLDVSQNSNLKQLECNNNSLEALNIKNGNLASWLTLDFSNNPNLQYVCADDADVSLVQQKINTYGYGATCHVNSYCSFTPGGTYYTIQGNNKFDSNNNGCDVSDINYPNLKYTITDGTTTGSFIANTIGDYYLPVQVGTHTIAPVIENPSYFIVSPASTIVTFPTQTSPFTQDFCVTPNGVHSDVEVTVIPVEAARPGFNAPYKIVYKNKGNQNENGSVNLTFDDTKKDYVSSNPVFNSQATNQFTWNYANLQPFETRFIDVVFNINTPMESLPVNGGDVLSYTSSITTANTDELPNDNSFTLNQTIVNSFDPNDITCLEGATVSTAKVGDYVHYMIRFENTGSANATNIVVKDVVDSAKFDVNSIVPSNGSHDYYTRINGNNVEFIFENINLSFDDASNDGYVSFKIKTKATLVAGDTFSKNANIYFDYNFPITTNTSNTVIAALSTQDFEFKNYFRLYPNPVSNTLTIETKNSIQMCSINIYNTLGQLVLVIPNAQETKAVDVSSLSSGNYFIKINSDKGSSNTKFIKQ